MCPRCALWAGTLVLAIWITLPFSSAAHAVTTQWQNLAGGAFTDPFNWTRGVPDGNDIALFNSGFVAYEVVFPTSSIFDPPPNFSVYDLIVATNEVSFVYTFFPFQNPPSLTVLDPNLSIVVGESPGDVSILNMAIGRLSGANASIGALAGAIGTLNVGGTFSVSGALQVGDAGTGTLNVTAGGRVESFDANLGHMINPAHLADSAGFATVSGAGSTWTVANALTVGRGGPGRLTIQAGGRVSSNNATIADEFDADGAVIVTGAGSTWTNSGNLSVGKSGFGVLEINGGSAVSSNTAEIRGGNAAGGSEVTVTGAGSTWTIGDALTVRRGSLTITDGANVSNRDCEIAGPIGFSLVTVSGAGSTWTNNGNLTVGYSGLGIIRITDGGAVSSNSADIRGGDDLGGSRVFVTGAGSNWTVGNAFRVGQGLVTIDTGGTISSGDGFLGGEESFFVPGPGSVRVRGANSVWNILGRLSIGWNAGPGLFRAPGTLEIDPGGTVLVAEDIVLFPAGEVRLQGGHLAALAVAFESVGEFNWTAGTFQVDSFDGDLLNQGGTLLPGSANLTAVAGDYTQQSAGAMDFRIGGTIPGAEFNQVTVDGVASLHGTLNVSLVDNFSPAAGDMFEIITTTGGLAGMFATELLPPLAANLDWNVIYGANSVTLEIVAPGMPGDYNQNGTVDAADYVVWRKNVGSGTSLPNDDTPGVGQDDYTRWRANFGRTGASGATAGLTSSANAAVPEPACAALVCLAMAGLWMVVRSRLHRQ